MNSVAMPPCDPEAKGREGKGKKCWEREDKGGWGAASPGREKLLRGQSPCCGNKGSHLFTPSLSWKETDTHTAHGEVYYPEDETSGKWIYSTAKKCKKAAFTDQYKSSSKYLAN